MCRTITGVFFTCKVCGGRHFLEGRVNNLVFVPCVHDENEIRRYNKEDFQMWQGPYEIVEGDIVDEADFKEIYF